MAISPSDTIGERDFLLNATASTAGALLSKSTFVIPQFQREYSWQLDQVSEFWQDLSQQVDSSSYFLGLIILTDESDAKHVVDGQQRLITLSLLATAIVQEAKKSGRNALADRLTADFLKSIDFDSDEIKPRLVLSDEVDNGFFQQLIEGNCISVERTGLDAISNPMIDSYNFLSERLKEDLKKDPFKRLGRWSEFLTNRLHFAVFVHPDSTSAYQVYEVINTRGKELTTADLLKNYILSQTPIKKRKARYQNWQELSRQFLPDGPNTFVQFIRHSVTVRCGHVLPKDLFGFLAQRQKSSKTAPSPDEVMELLNEYQPIYSQMVDPTLPGPASGEALKVFAALNSIGVIAVRPILLALSSLGDERRAMRYLLQIVVRRIVVGNLGTGNVERRLGEAARNIFESKDSAKLYSDLKDLNPPKNEFVEQLRKRSFNKTVLAFLRRSIIECSITPSSEGTLHFIWTQQAEYGANFSEEDGSYWASTIGNTVLANTTKRTRSMTEWNDFKEVILGHAVAGEIAPRLQLLDYWSPDELETIGSELAIRAGEIWYSE